MARVTERLATSGLLQLYRPDQVARLLLAVVRYGFTPALGPTAGKVLYPGAKALVDDDGTLTFVELDRLCDAAGLRLRAAGLRPGVRVGLLARNSRGFYAAMVGAARAGLDVVYLNTGSTAPQLAEIGRSEGISALVYEAEFADRIPPDMSGHDVAELMAVPLPDGRPDAGGRRSQHVILTSGTTGRPRGVARASAGIDAALAMVAGFPHRIRRAHVVAAPMFHAWGWGNLLLAMAYCSTVVVTRRFDPERVLALVERERCEVLVAVPVMLQRLVDLDPAVTDRYDTSRLKVAAVSGSALSGELASAFMDRYGDILYNLYGSTEAAFATIAEPDDLRAAPGTAGRPLPGVRAEVVDADGRPVPQGHVGEIVVTSRTAFSGYTSRENANQPANVRDGGAHRVRLGDLGRFDRRGRLFVVGRADDMVVTGGENVYPVTVEHAFEGHPDVLEAAAVGVADQEFGQAVVVHLRLRDDVGRPPSADDLRTWSKARLAPHEVPRRVVLHTEPLPRNETGKVVKSRLSG